MNPRLPSPDRRPTAALARIALLVLASLPGARADGTVELSTPALSAAWDAGRGALVSLKDRATGREWLDPDTASPLYAIRLVDGADVLTDALAIARRVRREGDAVIVECDHGAPVPLTVVCTFRPAADGPHLAARIGIRAPAPIRLAEVRFPLVTLRTPFSGDGANDRILRPECDGSLLCNPAVNRGDRTLVYPGGASLQMIAAYDPSAGLALMARDASGSTKGFGCRRNGRGQELGVGHLPAQSPADRWDPGYDVVFAAMRPPAGMTEVVWESAADLYRAWAERQPWCRRTLAERVKSGEVPAWLCEPSLFFAYSLRGMDAHRSWTNRLPEVAHQAAAWRDLLGAPTTFMLMAWEKKGPWVTPDYFPPFGGDRDFMAATATLHGGGHHALVFLSGLKWTLRKTPATPPGAEPLDDTAAFAARGATSAIAGADGRPLTGGAPGEGVGEHAQICAATPLARELLMGAAAGCRRLGIDCVQADQIVGGGQPPCLSAGHGHPPGGGAWAAAAMLRLFGDIRHEGRRDLPTFAWSMEEPGEFFIQELDTYHARDYAQGRWPRSGPGVLGVPLFTHVYHEYMHGYGGDSCAVSTNDARPALYQQAMNLVCGKAPGVAVWTSPWDPARTHPFQTRLLRAHMALWSGPARDFLVFGRRIASAAPAVPPVELTLVERDGRTHRTISAPSVLHGTWRAPDGRTGTVYACIGGAPVEFPCGTEKVRLEPGEAVFRAAR